MLGQKVFSRLSQTAFYPGHLCEEELPRKHACRTPRGNLF
ncbi:Uncharacterized protein dnm_057220 [Desulfonema magnum]|uniref:Uncharacterized protein n=1 Tax=Desulfonema magnum TaxID=45655 RepID=A0A975BRC9_9BACT|nr:Uncharacterized protein dnm_057220 [Desulfonema magnum]